MIELKSVLHYYIGQKCTIKKTKLSFLGGIVEGKTEPINEDLMLLLKGCNHSEYIAPHLRPISSLTDDEKVKWYDIRTGGNQPVYSGKPAITNMWLAIFKRNEKVAISPDEFHFFLSIGIDLFQLLDTHQAIVHIDK